MRPSDESDAPETHSDDNLLVDGIDDPTFFQTLVKDAGEAILTLDAAGMIVSANPAAGQLFGYEVDDLIGEHMSLLFPSEYVHSYCEQFEVAVSTSEDDSESVLQTTLERVGLHADGETILLRFSFTEQTYDGQRLFTAIIRDLTEQQTHKQKRRDSEARFRQIAEQIDSVLWMADAEMTEISYVNPAYEDVWGRSRESLYQDLPTFVDAVHPDDCEQVEEFLDHIVHDSRARTPQREYIAEYRVVQPDGTIRWVSDRAFPVYNDAEELHRIVGVAEDITAQKQREATLQRQREILQTISEINTVLRQVNKSMVEATTQSEIEDMVCEHLVASELYQAALIGDLEPTTEGISIRTSYGTEETYLEAIREANPTDTEQGAAAQALETGEIHIIDDIETDPAFPESVREAALSQEYRSALCVPLVYNETTYGVLVVYGTQAAMFSEHEQAIFDELGETLGYAIYALKTQQLLFTDRVVELDFDLTETDGFFVTVSEELDCSITLDGIVQTNDGDLLEYIEAEDVAPEQILERADCSPDVRQARCITTHEETSRFEFLFQSETTTLNRLIEQGATIKTATATNGHGTLTVKVPTATELRSFVDAVQTVHPKATLAAKRERERSSDSPTGFREQVRDQLTDRQHEILQTAYYSGYFESPRESTGAELADTLRISGPTFHQHLQAAHRKLLTTFFTPPTAAQ
ncbi:bacterio-opsin activator domain-containing protein [Haladaptatus pallidirubidus]|uniref:Bacterioopsin transcriptional activator Bat n=1 Tax=Haladaptatus pallidirubidus TaxID=1008152 RepID=A0AAV3UNF4_9EURY|nr:bacterio-opsin activator domain-containing protein [Haladaptatus pallidirubidus]